MNRVCNSYDMSLIPQGFVLTFITVSDLSMSFSVVNGGTVALQMKSVNDNQVSVIGKYQVPDTYV